MKLGEFLNNVFTSAGVEVDDEKLKAIVTATANIDFDESLEKTHQKHYLTEEAAKNHPALISHHKASVLNAIDKEVAETLEAIGLSDDAKSQITNEKSSFKKPGLLARLAYQEAKGTGKPEGNEDWKKEKETLVSQVNELKSQVSKITETHIPVEEHQSKLNEYTSKLEDVSLNSFLSQKNLIDVAKEEGFLLPKARIKKAIKEKGLVPVMNENGGFDLKTAEGSDYYEGNKKVTADELFESAISGYIRKSDGVAPPVNGNNGTHQYQPDAPKTSFEARAKELADEAIKNNQ